MFFKNNINILEGYKKYKFNKIMNGKYLVLDNITLYKEIKELNINNTVKTNIIQDFFPEFIKTYKYFNYFNKINDDIIKNFEIIDTYAINRILNTKHIRGNVKKINNKNGNIQYMLGYTAKLKNINQIINFINKHNLSVIWSIDINIYNPHIFLNETILYFVDLILFNISTDTVKISNLLKSIFIGIDNIVLNIENDKTLRKTSKDIIKNDKYYKYFILTVLEKIIGLGKININFFIFFEEKKGYLFNQIVKNVDNTIIFEENNKYKGKTAVETLNLLNNNLNSLSNDFWNIIIDNNLVISDDLSIYYEDQIKYLKTNILKI